MMSRVPDRIGLRACYPWIIVTTGTLVLDLVACVAYGMDATDFTSPSAVANITNVNIPDSWFGTTSSTTTPDYHASLVVGPLILLFVILRGIVFWLLNLVLLIHVVRAVVALHKDNAINDADAYSDNRSNRLTFNNDLKSGMNVEEILEKRSSHGSTSNTANDAAESQISDEVYPYARDRVEGKLSRSAALPPRLELGRSYSDRVVSGEWSVGQRPPGNLHGLLTRPMGPMAPRGSVQSTPTPPPTPSIPAVDELRREMPWSYLESSAPVSPVIEASPTAPAPHPLTPHGRIVHNVVLPPASHAEAALNEEGSAYPTNRQFNRSLSGDQWSANRDRTLMY